MTTDATPGVGADASDDLEALGPDPNPNKVRTVRVGDDTVEIRPMRMRQIREFSRHAKPLLAYINEHVAGRQLQTALADPQLIFDLQIAHGEALNHAVAIAARLPFDVVDELEPDVWLELTVKVWACNLDFFVHRLLPSVAAVMRDQAGELDGIERAIHGLGPTASTS